MSRDQRRHHHRHRWDDSKSLSSSLLSGLPDSVDGVHIRGKTVSIKIPERARKAGHRKESNESKPESPSTPEDRKRHDKQPTPSSKPKATKVSKGLQYSMSIKRLYPVAAEELDREDWRKLTEVLHIENNCKTKYEITGLIKHLPSNLSRNLIMRLVPKFIVPAAKLCDPHRGMNPHVIAHIFELVQAEVGFHLDVMLNYPRYDKGMSQEQKMVIKNLRALKGIWTQHDSLLLPGEMPDDGPWAYQTNRCEACALARVGSSPDILRDLRITLLSRTRTRKFYKEPRLTPFVEGCIEYHENSSELFRSSSDLASAFKAARKVAVKHYLRSRRRERHVHHESNPHSRERRHSGESAPLNLLVIRALDEPQEQGQAGPSARRNELRKIEGFDPQDLHSWLETEPRWVGGDRGSELSPKVSETVFSSNGEIKADSNPNHSTQHLNHEDEDEEGEHDGGMEDLPQSQQHRVDEVNNSNPQISPLLPSYSPTPPSVDGLSSPQMDTDTNWPSQDTGANSSDSHTLIPEPLFSGKSPQHIHPEMDNDGDTSKERLEPVNFGTYGDYGNFGDDMRSVEDDNDSMRSVSPTPSIFSGKSSRPVTSVEENSGDTSRKQSEEATNVGNHGNFGDDVRSVEDDNDSAVGITHTTLIWESNESW